MDKYITSQHYSELIKYKDLYEKEKKRADLLQADLSKMIDFFIDEAINKNIRSIN